ncbi:MAG: hypothetical protein EBS42_06255, partial [Caulobacteraceae bacterium]|nr:hypothetical protein [Caulobacteraceae bacterium]
AAAFSGAGDGAWAGDANHHGYFNQSGRVLDDVAAALTGQLADQIAGRVYVPEKRMYRLATV